MTSDSLIWTIILPLSGALLSVVLRRHRSIVGGLTTLATVGAGIALLRFVIDNGAAAYPIGGWTAGLGIALRADGLSAMFVLMGSIVALATSIYASAYFKRDSQKRYFWPLWLLMLSALNALFLSADLFNLYVGLELLGLSAVALTALGGNRSSVEAAIRYLSLGLLGSLSFLAGVVLLYTAYGTLDMVLLAGLLENGAVDRTAATLVTLGLLIKTALFPLHFWLPPAHANAPAPVSAALSSLTVKTAFYLVLRLWLDLFEPLVTRELAYLFGLLGGTAIIWGSWRALRAERLKLLAAYSTVAQIGYLFLFLPLVLHWTEGDTRQLALGGLALMALTHGFAKSALFLAAGTIQQQAGHDRIGDLNGTAQSLPATTFALALAGVALIGLPPSGAFLGKWQLIAIAIQAELWLWVSIVAVGSLLAAAYIFRLLGHAFGQARYPAKIIIIGRQEVPALLLGMVATLALGLTAAPIWSWLDSAMSIGGPGS